MRRIKPFVALAALAIASGSALAQQQTGPEAGTPYVGGLLGAALPLGDGDSDLTFGAEAGYHLNDKVAAGLYFTTFGSSTGTGLFETDSSTSFLAAFGDYYLGPMLHVGAMLGAVFSSIDLPGDAFDTDDTDLVIGARAGYDINVADNVTVGPEANILFSTAEESDPLLNLLGAVKFHF